MKLIIAHLPSDAFSSVRTALIDLGVLRVTVSEVTVSEVHTASSQSAITLRYRGAPLHSHLRPELRLECVATDGQSPMIINVLRGYAGSAGQVAVLELEELHQESSQEPVFSDDPRLEAAVH
jgi:nitrogen regulatory protein PII